MFPVPSIGAVVVLITLQLCAGEESCTVWSDVGAAVEQGLSFRVYCSFKCRPSTVSMYCYDPKTNRSPEQPLAKHNSTTVYFNVHNITGSQTYSCRGSCHTRVDDCGLDMEVGYPPDQPTDLSCVNQVFSRERSTVTCTWSRGRDTKLINKAVLHMSLPGSQTVQVDARSKGRDLRTASFNVSTSVHNITVWIQTRNGLGSKSSAPTNYTLCDIAVPPTPVLGQPRCSSRECVLKVQQFMVTRYLEVEYGKDTRRWLSKQESGAQVRLSSLEPFSSYRFRVRCRFDTGLWSRWSAEVSGQTEEEAPAKELDVWYAEQDSGVKSLRVYWKEANTSVSRGKITQYTVRVYSPHSGIERWKNISADLRSSFVPFCADCEVTVWSQNSKGASPPARVWTHREKDSPLEVVLKTLSNHSVSISWGKCKTARQPAGFVVEWYPKGQKEEELNWVRLGGNESSAVLTGLAPFECYAGALYVVYDDGFGNQSTFSAVTTLESVPAAVPSVLERVEGNRVTVSWMEVPRRLRGGCITGYSIYLESDSGWRQTYHVLASERTYTIKDLPSAMYSLWVTASTAQGEGPKGQRSKVKFFIQHDTQMSLLLICVAVILFIALVCLCAVPVVKQRILQFIQCLALDQVPDPANSKWAKECTQGTGKVKLQLQLSNCSITEEEEEKEEEDPILVDVEELPKQGHDNSPPEVSAQLFTSRLNCDTNPEVFPYPVTTYIKSFSHNSDSSSHTETSGEIGTTVDYISSHGPEHVHEEYLDEDEDEENFGFTMDFFPSHSTAIKGLQVGGMLTLDAVKINCSDFFQNERF